MLLPAPRVDKPGFTSREELRVEETKNNRLPGGKRFAIVDEDAPVRFLSRDEFELMKKLNPKLIQMKACGLVYLTEPPNKG
jgi:hypothetical protein